MTNLARKSWFVVHTKPRSEECAATFLHDRRGRGRDLAIEATRATTRNGGRAKGSTAARPAAVSHMEIAASLPPSCSRFGDRDLLQGALRAHEDVGVVPDTGHQRDRRREDPRPLHTALRKTGARNRAGAIAKGLRNGAL